MDGDPLAGGGAYFSYFVPGCFSMVFFKNASVSEQNKFRGSIVVSIPACHAGDPGSIPRLGDFLFVAEEVVMC